MNKSIASFKKDLGTLRTGRANPAMLDLIRVDVYGQKMPINQIATVTVPEPRTISIQVWDKNNVNLVDTEIKKSNLGVNPQVDGQILRIRIPQLTEERRKDLTKILKNLAEKSKIWKWFIFVGGFSGITAWLWIAFEATTDRRTLVVDFHETSYPVYKAISAISPDFTDFDQRAVLLNAAWLTTLGLATILTVLRKQIVQSSNPALLYRETSKRLIIEGTRKKLTVSKRVFKKS